MHPLSARQLVEIGERGSALHAVDRPLLLLGFACPEPARDLLAALTIGERDALLLDLRAQTFGPSLTGYAECVHCGEHLEFTFRTEEVLIQPRGPDRPALWEWSFGEHLVRFRLPNSVDLAAVAGLSDTGQARQHLIERCVSEIQRGGSRVNLADLPRDFPEQLSARMAECDPQADVQFAIRCPSCRVESRLVFDIASFFWAEVSAFARRLLREVHVLAGAYGWSEAEILSLQPSRRQFYLEMVGA